VGVEEEALECLPAAEVGPHERVVAHIEAVVTHRGLEDGEQPQRVDPEVDEVVQAVAHAIERTVVGEPLDVQRVDDGVLPPRRGQCRAAHRLCPGDEPFDVVGLLLAVEGDPVSAELVGHERWWRRKP
jgi:hypothetical protein